MASYESVQLEEEVRQKREAAREEGEFQMVYNCNRKISCIGLEKSNSKIITRKINLSYTLC